MILCFQYFQRIRLHAAKLLSRWTARVICYMGEVCVLPSVSIIAGATEWAARLGQSSSILLDISSPCVLLVSSPSPSELWWREPVCGECCQRVWSRIRRRVRYSETFHSCIYWFISLRSPFLTWWLNGGNRRLSS